MEHTGEDQDHNERIQRHYKTCTDWVNRYARGDDDEKNAIEDTVNSHTYLRPKRIPERCRGVK